MSKPFMISVALSALIVTAAPAMAQRHSGPSNLRDADHSPPTAAIAVPSLIRSRATPNQPVAPDNDSAAAGHVKVFDGATLRAGEPQPDGATDGHVKVFDGATLRAGEPQPEAAKPTLFVRKAGGQSEAAPQPDGEETAAARMQTQNNLKQMGLGAH